MLFEYVEKNEVEWQICKSLIALPKCRGAFVKFN